MTTRTALGEYTHLTRDELLELLWAVVATQPMDTLDAQEAFLRDALPRWFVYRGGSHISLHRESLGPRVLMIAEAPRG